MQAVQLSGHQRIASRESAHMSISQFRDKNLNFPEKPCLIPDLKFFQMPDGLGIQVLGAESVCIFRGPITETLLPWLIEALDGSRSIDEIFAQCPDEMNEEQLSRLLMTMFRRGIFAAPTARGEVSSLDQVRRKQLLFFGRKLGITRQHLTAESVEKSLANARLVLVGNGLFGTTTHDLLTRSGFGAICPIDWSSDGFMSESIARLRQEFPAQATTCQETVPVISRSTERLLSILDDLLPAADLLITACTSGSRELFEEVNRLCLRHSVRWLRGNDDGANFEIGPLVIPFNSACYRCLTLRKTSAAEHAIEEELYENELARSGEKLTHQGESLPWATMAAGVLSTEVVRCIGNITTPTLENGVLTITMGGAFRNNSVLQVPRCPDCFRGQIKTANVESPASIPLSNTPGGNER